jgi:HK97 family phage portal protein
VRHNPSVFSALRTATVTKAGTTLSGVDGSRAWWPLVREGFLGAWQNNVEVTATDVITHPTYWSCCTLIASDVAKIAVLLTKPTDDDIWEDVENPAYSPVLRKPNHFQTRIQFYESWMLSKLTRGNTYVLKVADNRTVVTGMHVLDPARVTPLVAPDGGVFYDLKRDDLSKLPEEKIVPARFIIHDRWNAVYHPLVGLSPIHAAGLSAVQGLKIQLNSAHLFANAANPGGVLTAPGHIKQATADRLKDYWDTNFIGASVGKVAVLGDGLDYKPMMMNAVDTEVIKQLNWADERICSAFHVPAYLVGVGPYPSYNNVQALSQQYHSQCLQIHFESIESLLDEGLGLLPTYRAMFDLDSLLRMDSATMMNTIKEGVSAGVLKPNEGRNQLNYPPVDGGDTPYLQQQNYSLAALDKRDTAAAAPTSAPLTAPAPAPTPDAAVPPDEDKALARDALLGKVLRRLSAVEAVYAT